MDRRNFLRMMVGGVATAAAVRTFPFRVFSFPKEIVVPDPNLLLLHGIPYWLDAPSNVGAMYGIDRSGVWQWDGKDLPKYISSAIRPVGDDKVFKFTELV